MAHSAADYRRGDMDVQDHLATYKAFGTLYKWGSLIAGTIILFFSVWLCAHAGFLAAAALAVIVFGLGCFWLTRKKPSEADIEIGGASPTHH